MLAEPIDTVLEIYFGIYYDVRAAFYTLHLFFHMQSEEPRILGCLWVPHDKDHTVTTSKENFPSPNYWRTVVMVHFE